MKLDQKMIFAVATFLSALIAVESVKVLGVFMTLSRSHALLGHELLKGLADRGHEVTMLTSFPSKPHPNYTELVLKSDIRRIASGGEEFNAFEHSNRLKVLKFLLNNFNAVEAALADETTQTLLKSNQTFDVVIPVAFYNEATFAIARHFNAHLVVFSIMAPTEMVNEHVGNPTPYAYVPTWNSLVPKTFKDRFVNTILGITYNVMKQLIHYPVQNQIMHKFFPDYPNIHEVVQDTSIMLLSSHMSVSHTQPLVPNMIEIGGFQVKEPKPLPKDLQTFLDSAKDGAIFFSLGSNVNSKLMPPEMKKAILEALGNLKEKVLWKWEDEEVYKDTKNIKIQKWFPQSDILAHPNIKLFVTHGGWGSLNEAIVRKVPIVGIPIMAEQTKNILEAEVLGIGIGLNLHNITRDSFLWAVREVLNNPRYAEKAKEIGDLYMDREMPPMDRASFWVDYVVRTKGAKHLRSAALDLHWYQLILLDVFGVLAVLVILVCFVVRFLLKLLCSRRKKLESKSQNKKLN